MMSAQWSKQSRFKEKGQGPTLIFGLGSLHRLPLPGQRQRLLGAALDAGFQAFDVAPAYGNGLDEVELGRAIAGRRDKVRIHTKYGIPMALYGARSRYLFPFLRAADKVANPGYSKRYLQRDFTPEELVRSLEGSLKRMRTDHVDLLLIHEPLAPIPPSLFQEIAGMAERLRQAGTIRAFGIAGGLQTVRGLLGHAALDVFQAPLEDILEEGASAHPAMVAYGVHRGYLKAKPKKGDFGAFVRDLESRHPALRLILSTTKLSTLATFGELFR